MNEPGDDDDDDVVWPEAGQIIRNWPTGDPKLNDMLLEKLLEGQVYLGRKNLLEFIEEELAKAKLNNDNR